MSRRARHRRDKRQEAAELQRTAYVPGFDREYPTQWTELFPQAVKLQEKPAQEKADEN